MNVFARGIIMGLRGVVLTEGEAVKLLAITLSILILSIFVQKIKKKKSRPDFLKQEDKMDINLKFTNEESSILRDHGYVISQDTDRASDGEVARIYLSSGDRLQIRPLQTGPNSDKRLFEAYFKKKSGTSDLPPCSVTNTIKEALIFLIQRTPFSE